MKAKIAKLFMGGLMAATLLTGSSQIISATEVSQPEEVTKEQYAASQTEVEANGTVLSLNKTTTGVLSERGEEDWYIFDITQRGYFQVQLNPSANADADDINNGWNLIIYKKGDLINAVKGYYGITGNCLSANLPMESGRYYAVVETYDTYSDERAPIQCPYEITAKFTASDIWEVEGNDTNTTCNSIAVNQDYQGTLYHRTDVDWYCVKTSANGTIQVDFYGDANNNQDDINNGWDITVYDKDYKELKYYGDITSKTTAKILPFAKGTYYIKVCASDTYSDERVPIDCIYHLNVNYNKTSSWESEYNETKATADSISPDKNYSGSLYHRMDTDWYKVQTTENGYFQVSLNISDTVNVEDIHNGWNIAVMDSKANVIKTYTKITSNMTTAPLPYAKGTYYIKVYANDTYSDNRVPIDCIYKLKVKQTKNSSWESEVNDTLKKADSISLNKKYKGIFTNYTDVDWYKASVSDTGVLQIKLSKGSDVDVENIHKGWNVTVYKSSIDNEVAKLKGVTSSDSVKINVKKGTYYIKVCANDTYSEGRTPTQCTYQLSANYSKTPAAVKISSATGGKKQVTVKWKKVSKASGYYVYRSTSKNGKYTKVATIKKGSTVKYTDKKLKANKKYYYKVKAYTTTNGVKAEGSFSSVKSAKTKK